MAAGRCPSQELRLWALTGRLELCGSLPLTLQLVEKRARPSAQCAGLIAGILLGERQLHAGNRKR